MTQWKIEWKIYVGLLSAGRLLASLRPKHLDAALRVITETLLLIWRARHLVSVGGSAVRWCTSPPTNRHRTLSVRVSRRRRQWKLNTTLEVGRRSRLNNTGLFICGVRGRSDERTARLCVYIRPPLSSLSYRKAVMPTTLSSALH